jgi:cytochrome c-type protein NapC
MPRAKPTVKGTLLSIVWLTIAACVFAGAVVFTDQPQFCANCHEMLPHYNAWARGPHKSLACVDCHVDPGAVSHTLHKFAAFKEIAVHFVGRPAFPLPDPPELPDSRCRRCHNNLPAKTKAGFDHTLHTRKACAECHADIGHAVSAAALKAEGVYAGDSFSAIAEQAVVRAGAGSRLNGHLKVVCSNCHKMGQIGCATCHTPKHKNQADRGTDCKRCHKPGLRFVFSHPTISACSGCHALPTKHYTPIAGAAMPLCTMCHRRPGVSLSLIHI